MTDEHAALSLEGRKWSLMMAHEGAALEPLLSDELHYLHSSGSKDDKASYLARLSGDRFRYRHIRHTIETVVPMSDDAVAFVGEVTIDMTVDGADHPMHSRFLSLWRKEGEAWKLVVQQTTPIREP